MEWTRRLLLLSLILGIQWIFNTLAVLSSSNELTAKYRDLLDYLSIIFNCLIGFFLFIPKIKALLQERVFKLYNSLSSTKETTVSTSQPLPRQGQPYAMSKHRQTQLEAGIKTSPAKQSIEATHVQKEQNEENSEEKQDEGGLLESISKHFLG